MSAESPRSMLSAIENNPDDHGAQLRALRDIVAFRLDNTDSARETGTLARCLLDIDSTLRSLGVSKQPASRVDELLQRRSARGAR